MTRESMLALEQMMRADNALSRDECESATNFYLEAIRLAESAPEHDPLFQKDFLLACCNAGLSSAFGRCGSFLESLACADRAIELFRPWAAAAAHQVDAERLLMAVTSKALSLKNLGQSLEALAALSDGRVLYTRANGSEGEARQRFDETATIVGIPKRGLI